MSSLMKWSISVALVLATANGALAAKKPPAAAKTDSFAAVETSRASLAEPEYFIQAKGFID